jgi:hypothetical protein
MHVPRALKCHPRLRGIQGKQAIGFKKNMVIIHMLTPKTPKDIQVFNGMAQYF